MSSLPIQLQRVGVPPIKCQGIKTKLVPFILRQIQWSASPNARWIEPFVGSGVVGFNLAPHRALFTDSNQHIIRFYQALQQGQIDRATVQTFLQQEGDRLRHTGADYYYQVRQRFNQTGDPLDFLFLNRACFNGLMRFNRQGGFNVPFCRKPQRFAPSYITKIANQVAWVAQQMQGKDWEFRTAPWQSTLQQVAAQDFVYLDPPYIGRHTDYYNTWDEAEARHLAAIAHSLPGGIALSMWAGNAHRQNDHLDHCWQGMDMRLASHFYHVGSQERWRGAVTEALLIKPGYSVPVSPADPPLPAAPTIHLPRSPAL